MTYKEIQQNNKNTVIMQLVGNFYRTYGDSAKVLSDVTGYKLVSSKEYECKCGFPATDTTTVKVCELLKKGNISYALYMNEEEIDRFGGNEEAFINIVSKDFTVEQQNKNTKSSSQSSSVIKGSGITFDDAMADVKRKIDELFLKKGREIISLSMIKETDNSIYAMVIYKE